LTTTSAQPARADQLGRLTAAGGQERSGPPQRLALALACAAFAVGLVSFLVPLRTVSLKAMDGLGLISALPIASIAGLVLMVAAFVAMLIRRRPAVVVLCLMLVAVVFCLDGVTALIEPLPRFPTAYQVSGFVNFVRLHGHVDPGLTAYFSWPGFFALIAFVTQAAGVHSLLPLLTWWPVVMDLLLLVPFLLLTRTLRISWRARWLAALLLCLGNWVGQDYFSPQSFNYLFYLVFITILLTWFSGQQEPVRAVRLAKAAIGQPVAARLRRLRAAVAGRPTLRTPGERPARQIPTAQRAILLALVIAIFVVATLSHQLTPFLMIAACLGLVLAGRCTPRLLPVLLAVIVIGWISYGAVGYWSGHLSTVFGNIGQLGGTVSASVSDRVSGSTIHQVVDKSRIGLAGLMCLLAVGGLVRRWRGGSTDRALVVLFLAPVTIVGLQSYGGEIALRVYLFALPAIVVLAACLFFPGTEPSVVRRPAGRSRAAGLGLTGIIVNGTQPTAAAEPVPAGRRNQRGLPAGLGPPAHGATAAEVPGAIDRFSGRLPAAVALSLAGVVAVCLSGLFLLARYGNEAYERIPDSEYKAMNYIYDHDQPGTDVLWLSRPSGVNATPQMPWQFRDLSQVQFVAMDAPERPASIDAVVKRLLGFGRGAFLITTTTESTFVRQTTGFPPTWEGKFRAALSANPDLREVYRGHDAAVYQAKLPASAPRASAPAVSAAPTGSTIWSPIGVGALIAALLLLTAREFIRECVPAKRWLLPPLAIAALPALALLLFAVAERFVVLS
jgi:hypothetical protein